jgi:hypothetical protein
MVAENNNALRVVEPWALLIAHTPAPAELVEAAGRTCYKSEPKGRPDAFVKMILGKKHHSVLEHASASFRFVTDRGISHEIVRHRIASYSQESTRFVNYSENGRMGGIQVIIPPRSNRRTVGSSSRVSKRRRSTTRWRSTPASLRRTPAHSSPPAPRRSWRCRATCGSGDTSSRCATLPTRPAIRLLAGSVLQQLREVASAFFPEEPSNV